MVSVNVSITIGLESRRDFRKVPSTPAPDRSSTDLESISPCAKRLETRGTEGHLMVNEARKKLR
jgi:hypothetical protein